MRSAEEVERFRVELAERFPDDEARASYYADCYEACIPRLFWDITSADVTHNRGQFTKVVMKYCARRKRAQRNGYGLLFTGDNGVGKTTFIAYVLTQMLKRGVSAYYTTIATLDKDIKRTFRDKDAERRLDIALNANFLALDELGKEHFKTDSFLNTQLESILKTRHDDGDPTLLATNLDINAFGDAYGPSVQSMIDGRYTIVFLETGDFRKALAGKMRKDMGF